MNEALSLKSERTRRYAVFVCFVPRSLKERYVRAAKMRRGRTISGFIRESMELLLRTEGALLPKVEVLTHEYAEREYLSSHLRPELALSEPSDRTSSIVEGMTETRSADQKSGMNVIPTRTSRVSNPILTFIEGKSRGEM